MSYVLLWNDDKEEAIAEFTRVAEASRPESTLRLELAELLEQQGERDDALAAADAVQPMDNATMKRREELALRVAVLTGNLERARKAAERLFGLRLDTDTQIRLSGQMHQLGLHELAEAVLGRARRRAGNKAAALVSLMIQYQKQDKLDVAVQVAMQILHTTTGARQTNPNVYNPDDPDAARIAAIGVLSRSGRLTQLIDKAREQLAKTPNSVQIHQALADYYKAANRREEARAELAAIVKLRPDDLAMRFQIAQQLVQDGQAAGAIEHYKVHPQEGPHDRLEGLLPGRRAPSSRRAKSEELLGLFETLDLRQVSHPFYVIDAISGLPRRRQAARPGDAAAQQGLGELPRLSPLHLRLHPRRRDLEISRGLRSPSRRSCPSPEDFAPGNEWDAFDQILAYSSDGRMTTVVSKLLDLAASQGRLDELSAQVQRGAEGDAALEGGQVVRALVDGRLGRFDRAKELITGFLEQTGRRAADDDGLRHDRRRARGPCRDPRSGAGASTSARIYRTCTDTPNRVDFDSGCGKRLVTIYMREDRPDDARRILVDFMKNVEDTQGYSDDYIQQLTLLGWSSVANKMAELGFAADAVAAYGEALALDREIPASSSNYIGNREEVARRCREGITRTLDGLKDDELKSTLDRLVANGKAGPAGPGHEGTARRRRGVPAPGSRESRGRPWT